MTDISLFFEPAGQFNQDKNEQLTGKLGLNTEIYSEKPNFPDFKNADIAIVGVLESRGSEDNHTCRKAPNAIRKQFYELYKGYHGVKLVDLGNIKPGNTIEDTYFALQSVLRELIMCNTLPIVLGGSQDLTYANYLAYEDIKRTVNIAAIDSRFDLGSTEDELKSETYLSKIILREPNFLFNLSNIGYQSYFVDENMISLMERLYFDAYRLGAVRGEIEKMEPVLRNADLVTFDMSVIKASDSAANPNASPNGLYAEEVCQLFKYAGIGDRVSSVGIYEYDPDLDPHGLSAQLVAQMMWSFIEGFYMRTDDIPMDNSKEYSKYRVTVKDGTHEIVFYKSHKSDRWWMNIPVPAGNKNRFERHHMVPCTYDDYEVATREEMPDRWWRTYQKLS